MLRGLYPPGSTIKPAVAIAGLDSGVITGSSRVYDPGYYQLPNYDHKYRNWNRTGDGYVDLDTAGLMVEPGGYRPRNTRLNNGRSMESRSAAEMALGGRRGAVVALNPTTGEVLAMVSQPSFDAKAVATGVNTEGAAMQHGLDAFAQRFVFTGDHRGGQRVLGDFPRQVRPGQHANARLGRDLGEDFTDRKSVV